MIVNFLINETDFDEYDPSEPEEVGGLLAIYLNKTVTYNHAAPETMAEFVYTLAVSVNKIVFLRFSCLKSDQEPKCMRLPDGYIGQNNIGTIVYFEPCVIGDQNTVYLLAPYGHQHDCAIITGERFIDLHRVYLFFPADWEAKKAFVKKTGATLGFDKRASLVPPDTADTFTFPVKDGPPMQTEFMLDCFDLQDETRRYYMTETFQCRMKSFWDRALCENKRVVLSKSIISMIYFIFTLKSLKRIKLPPRPASSPKQNHTIKEPVDKILVNQVD